MKTYLITGATSGIGKQIFKDIYNQEDLFILVGRTESKFVELKNEMDLSENVLTFCDNLNDQKFIDSIAASIQGGIDGIVLCAGIPGYKPISFIGQHLRDVMEINFFSQAFLIESLLKKKKLKKNSSVVFMSSIASMTASSGLAAYAASKGALNSFARVMAIEVARDGIRVNCICPGMVETPLAAQVRKELSNEAVQQDMKKYPLGYSEPKDVSGMAVFLLSDAARKVTGQTFVVDGGYSIQ